MDQCLCTGLPLSYNTDVPSHVPKPIYITSEVLEQLYDREIAETSTASALVTGLVTPPG